VPNVRWVFLTGLELWFNSRDHLPPHFHAEKVGQWEVRVMFMRQPVELELRLGGVSPRGRTRSGFGPRPRHIGSRC
jgi:hypothetical protein